MCIGRCNCGSRCVLKDGLLKKRSTALFDSLSSFSLWIALSGSCKILRAQGFSALVPQTPEKWCDSTPDIFKAGGLRMHFRAAKLTLFSAFLKGLACRFGVRSLSAEASIAQASWRSSSACPRSGCPDRPMAARLTPRRGTALHVCAEELRPSALRAGPRH